MPMERLEAGMATCSIHGDIEGAYFNFRYKDEYKTPWICFRCFMECLQATKKLGVVKIHGVDHGN